MANNRRQRARKRSGSILPREARFVARLDMGLGADGKRIRRSKSFATRRDAQAWIDTQRSNSEELLLPVADQRLDEYLRWWLGHEAPKGKSGRGGLALIFRFPRAEMNARFARSLTSAFETWS